MPSFNWSDKINEQQCYQLRKLWGNGTRSLIQCTLVDLQSANSSHCPKRQRQMNHKNQVFKPSQNASILFLDGSSQQCPFHPWQKKELIGSVCWAFSVTMKVAWMHQLVSFEASAVELVQPKDFPAFQSEHQHRQIRSQSSIRSGDFETLETSLSHNIPRHWCRSADAHPEQNSLRDFNLSPHMCLPYDPRGSWTQLMFKRRYPGETIFAISFVSSRKNCLARIEGVR